LEYSSTMSAQEQVYLPTPELDLPRELPEEIPAHAQSLEPKESFQQTSQTAPSYSNDHNLKTLLSWHAPGRPYRKRKRSYFINSLLLTLLILVILFLFGQYMLMMLTLSLLFVSFALAIVPPHPFHYRISTEGITIEDHSFLWQELYDFYFKRRDGIDILVIGTKAYIPGELTITLGDMNKDHVRSVLLPYLPYREAVQQTFMEKSGDWLAKTFPLEKDPHEV
jgi:hypothetical protein